MLGGDNEEASIDPEEEGTVARDRDREKDVVFRSADDCGEPSVSVHIGGELNYAYLVEVSILGK